MDAGPLLDLLVEPKPSPSKSRNPWAIQAHGLFPSCLAQTPPTWSPFVQPIPSKTCAPWVHSSMQEMRRVLAHAAASAMTGIGVGP